MNLRSLFNKLLPPKKAATSSFSPIQRPGPNKFSVQFINMEDSPVYPLGESFSVGSEVGDVIIDDPSLSPKHATFHVRNGLVSVIDHASSEGIKLKDALLPKGRAVILEVDDELFLGNIQVRLIGEVDESYQAPPVEHEEEKTSIKPQKSFQEMPFSVEEKEEEEQEEIVEVELPEEPIIKAPHVTSPTGVKKSLFSHLFSKLKKKKVHKKPAQQPNARKTVGGGIHRSANTIPRVFGLVLDGLWTLILWQIFSPIQDFTLALEIIPELFHQHVAPLVNQVVQLAGVEAQFNSAISSLTSLISGLEGELKLSYLLSLFIFVRLIGTVIFGVSLGDYMSGIRSQDSALWKRGGGLLREFFGFFLAPFIVFDLPAILSRRTFKEIISFTTLYVPSKSSVVVSLLFYVPITLGCLLLSPFITGLELPEDINFVEQTIHRKSKRDATEVKVERTEFGSDWFGATFAIDGSQWWIYPKIILGQDQAKKILKPTLIFYKQSGVSVPLDLDKTFSWQKVVAPIFSHNIFAHEEYPTIWKFVKSSLIEKNSSLSYRPTELEKSQFEIELQALITVVFKLTPETLVEHVQTHGPFIKGYMEARTNLLSLISGQHNESWSLTQLGKTPFLVYEASGTKPSEYLIPLVAGKGRVFKIEYDSGKDKSKNGTLARGEIWSKTNWEEAKISATYDLVRLIDTVAKLASPTTLNEGLEKLENVYGAFFENASRLVVLPPENAQKVSLVQALENANRVFGQIASYHKKSNPDLNIEVLEKLILKLTDMKAQLESGNGTFFGLLPKAEKVNKPGKRSP